MNFKSALLVFLVSSLFQSVSCNAAPIWHCKAEERAKKMPVYEYLGFGTGSEAEALYHKVMCIAPNAGGMQLMSRGGASGSVNPKMAELFERMGKNAKRVFPQFYYKGDKWDTKLYPEREALQKAYKDLYNREQDFLRKRDLPFVNSYDHGQWGENNGSYPPEIAEKMDLRRPSKIEPVIQNSVSEAFEELKSAGRGLERNSYFMEDKSQEILKDKLGARDWRKGEALPPWVKEKIEEEIERQKILSTDTKDEERSKDDDRNNPRVRASGENDDENKEGKKRKAAAPPPPPSSKTSRETAKNVKLEKFV